MATSASKKGRALRRNQKITPKSQIDCCNLRLSESENCSGRGGQSAITKRWWGWGGDPKSWWLTGRPAKMMAKAETPWFLSQIERKRVYALHGPHCTLIRLSSEAKSADDNGNRGVVSVPPPSYDSSSSANAPKDIDSDFCAIQRKT